MAARSRPSRVAPGSPARSSGMVAGGAEDVAVGGGNHDGQVPGVDVDRYHGTCPELVQRRCRGGRGLPGRVEVPAARCRVAADVVTDRARRGLGGDLVPPVGELHRARQPVAAVRPVRQLRERGGQPDLQPALAGVPADRFVPQRLVLLPVSGQEQPGRFPPRPPPVHGWPGGGEVRALAQQRPATPHHRDRPRRQPPVRPGQPGLQRPQPDGLSVPLGRGGVPAGPPGLPARRDRQPGLDPADPGPQAGLPGAQVPPGEPVLILAGAGDRPGPPR